MFIFVMVVLTNIGLCKGYPDYAWPIRISNSVINFFYGIHSALFVIPSMTLMFVVKSYFAPTAIDTTLYKPIV